jgi:cell division protein ZapA
MKTPIEVEIFGQTFTVTSEDDERYVHELAAYLDRQMRRVAENAKTFVPIRVAIMAALSIADEYHQALRRESDTKQGIDRLSSLLSHILEQNDQPRQLAEDDSTVNAFSAKDSVSMLKNGEKKNTVSLS